MTELSDVFLNEIQEEPVGSCGTAPAEHAPLEDRMSQESPEQHAPGEPSVPDPVPAPATDADAPPWPKMEDGSPTLATDTSPTDPGTAEPAG